MRTALKRFNAYPSREGAERTFTELADGPDEYCREVEALHPHPGAGVCMGPEEGLLCQAG